jgi:hypothetical protein
MNVIKKAQISLTCAFWLLILRDHLNVSLGIAMIILIHQLKIDVC